jgi:SAM-dependent methyltransferase
MTGTPQYLSWVANTIRKHLGDSIIEIGAGIGNLTGRLMGRRLTYVAAERDPLYLHALRNRFLRTPNVTVAPLNPSRPEDFEPWQNSFETALCLNVLEYADDPATVLRSLTRSLKIDGLLIVLVPQGLSLFGSVDRTLGHKRRFSRRQVTDLLEAEGLTVERIYSFNKIGKPAWWLSSRVLHRRHFNKITLKLFDKSVWFWRHVERIIPWNGLSLIAVARKRAGADPDSPLVSRELNAVGRT